MNTAGRTRRADPPGGGAARRARGPSSTTPDGTWNGVDPARSGAAVRELRRGRPVARLGARARARGPRSARALREDRCTWSRSRCWAPARCRSCSLVAPFFAVLLRRHERARPGAAREARRGARPEARRARGPRRPEPVHGDRLRQAGPLPAADAHRRSCSALDYATRHVFNRGNLAGVKTIHFARWVFLDGRRRVFFASNYDGSLESYMDDFIDKIAWGLNLVFTNGVGYPKTRWLVLRRRARRARVQGLPAPAPGADAGLVLGLRAADRAQHRAERADPRTACAAR